MRCIDLRKETDCCSVINDEYFLNTFQMYGPVLLNSRKLQVVYKGEGLLELQKTEFDQLNSEVSNRLQNDARYIYRQIEKLWSHERILAASAKEIDEMLKSKKYKANKVREYYFNTILFASHRFLYGFSFPLLTECLQDITEETNTYQVAELLSDLQISKRMTYYAYHHFMLYKTAERQYYEDRNCLDDFIMKAGFLSTRTVHPSKYEEKQFVEKKCSEIINNDGINGVQEKMRNIIADHHNAYIKLLKALDFVTSEQHRCKHLLPHNFQAYCHACNYLTAFEERKHYWRIKMFRVMGQICSDLNLDMEHTYMHEIFQEVRRREN